MHPKDPYDPSSRYAVSLDEAEEKGLLMHVDYDTLIFTPAQIAEAHARMRRELAASCARDLKVEDLSQDEQVDLYNRLVEIMASA